MLVVPLIIIVLAVPLIMGSVPRNGLYGFRTTRTMASDAIWYQANRVAGIALVLSGIGWLMAALILPRLVDSPRRAAEYAFALGLFFLGLAVAASFWFLNQLRE